MCINCGHERCYPIRWQCFKCQKCRREFSVTSKTVFAFRKMSFRDILTGLWLPVNSVKGKSALSALSRTRMPVQDRLGLPDEDARSDRDQT